MRSSLAYVVAWVALPTLFLVLMLGLPLARLGIEALSQGAELGLPGALTILQDNYLRWRLFWTLLQAALTSLLVCLLGVPIAWVLARLEFPGRNILLRVVMMPFVIPSLVAALGVMSLLGVRGLTQSWWGWGLEASPVLLIYGNVFFNLGLVIRATVEGLEHVSANQWAAAQTLGATPWRAFWRVQWPTLLPWLLSSVCLVFLFSFGSFGLALILGGHAYATLEVEIYTLVAHELRLMAASQLAGISLILTTSVALLYLRFEKLHTVPLPQHPILRQTPHTAGQMLACVLAGAAVLMVCVLPVLAIGVRLAYSSAQAWAVLLESETLRALFNSLRFSAMGTLLAMVLGLLHALASHRYSRLRIMAYFPLLVSPVAMAFGLLLAYPHWVASQVILLSAYALLAFPLVSRSISAALAAIPASWLHAAATLGASPWRCFWRITLPAIAPSLRNALALASATCLGEFAVTLFLSRPEWMTLTTLIHQKLSRPGALNLEEALVLSSLLLLLAWLVFVLMDRSHQNRNSQDVTRRSVDAYA
jgi:thiamine transport system permease protein